MAQKNRITGIVSAEVNSNFNEFVRKIKIPNCSSCLNQGGDYCSNAIIFSGGCSYYEGKELEVYNNKWGPSAENLDSKGRNQIIKRVRKAAVYLSGLNLSSIDSRLN
jgi:hypothetical protein